ncbi:MAG: radical SAM protein [Bacteroidetes bacterium]|nr:radical SAM protein [Bacteroidota bacterium]MBU1423714.1 radical SAM protein [Bacteroidota bacterium]MBU2472018.1 radical SAM protein [Bacteroidota bacterium]MBU2635870.1 radical SAM protein [Bacteroidota bacterium]
MTECKICQKSSRTISKVLGVCLQCIRGKPDQTLEYTSKAHRNSREAFRLPEEPAKDPDGILCEVCVNECKIPENKFGYCGLRRNIGGKLIGTSNNEGKLSWYYDPLPTNCVADWVCAAGTGVGYPKFAHCKGAEYGYKNLAVFFNSCSFNCFFCQNWHYRQDTLKSQKITVDEFVSIVDERTSCICYFGGDPTPQIQFSINSAREALRKKKERILRICWETNGSMNKEFMNQILDIAIESGGCIKFDLKAWDENLNIALTSVSSKRTLENFEEAGSRIHLRTLPPLIIASTLLIPGYVDLEEIGNLSKFIASVNPEIPYSLLAFYPRFYMSDLPFTTRSFAEKCCTLAKEAGLKNVKIGNVHLLQ